MDSEKKIIFRIVIGLVALIAVVAGFALITLMPVLKITDGDSLTLQYFIEKVTPLFNNPSDIDAIKAGFFPMFVVLTYGVTYIFGLIYIIKLIVDLFSKKEDVDRKIRFDTASLSFVLLGFFAFLSFVMLQKNDPTDEIRLGLGSFLALGLGGVGALASACGYFLTSDKPVVNKVLRMCLMAVSFAAAILVFMQIFVVEGKLMSPFHLTLIVAAISFNGGTPNMELAMIAIGLSAALIIAFAFMNSVGISALETKKNKGPKIEKINNIVTIVLAAIAAILTATVIFVGPIVAKDSEVLSADPLNAYLALGAVVLALVLAILVVAVPEKAASKVEVATESTNETVEEQEEEPIQEEKHVEGKVEVAEAVVIADAVSEEQVEEVKVEEFKEEQKEEEKSQEVAPKEEKPAPAKTTTKKEKVPAKEKKKETPKKVEEKKAPTKKDAPEEPEEKKEAPKKNTASYHLSKRASDNKWQVFRAGSDKVIKLFNTKVEAEEYTKRMAENQGVSYLSHASKGKNKGRIQKK